MDSDKGFERPDPPLVSAEEAARLLGVSRTMVFGLIRGGALRSLKIGGRRLVVRDGIDEYVERESRGEAL